MAPDVIDLISSSPSGSGLPPLKSPTGTFNCRNGNLKRPVLTDIESVSDEFDFIHDSSDPFAADDSAKKRRRTSPLVRPLASNSTGVSGPALLRARNIMLSRKDQDPIEVSSSMEQASPGKRRCDSPRGTAWGISSPASRPDSPEALAMPFDSDPFASSQEAVSCPAKGPRRPTIRAKSLDPLESSPLPAACSLFKHSEAQRSPSYRTDAAVHDLNNPRLDTDSTCHPAQAPGRKWASDFLGSGVITIDDSDSSAVSADSEFPDVADIDVSRRRFKPRSPLRRTRSENVTRSSRTAAGINQTRSMDKEERLAAKAAAKEQKRLERAQAKAATALQKERAAALAEVNKLRTDKKVSTKEMIVDLPSSLSSEHKVQLEVLFEGLGVENTTWQCPGQNIVKWRRKVTSRFDEDLGRWEPIPPRIEDEEHVLVILSADELVSLVTKNELQAHASNIRNNFHHHTIIYLLQGVSGWLRRNRNLRNRLFTSGVRAHQTNASLSQRRSEASATEYVSEDLIEDALLRLQVDHDVLIHHTMIAAETTKWVATFTQHISTIPYRKQKDQATSTAGFCMESGQVRTGEGSQDTYIKMLQEIVRITTPIAYGVAAEFDSVTKLVNGLDTGGPGRLDGVKKSANKDGQLSGRSIGPAVSRRIYKVFTGRDEASTDV